MPAGSSQPRPIAMALREFVSSMDGPRARPARLTSVARILLLVVIPLVLLPTGIIHIQGAPRGWQPDTAWTLTYAWWVAAVAVTLCSLGVWLLKGKGVSQGLTIATMVALLVTNQCSMLAAGSLTNWGVLYVVALIAASRVFLDYWVALTTTLLGVLLLTAGVLVEWRGLLPLASRSPEPIVHSIYDNANEAFSLLAVSDLSVILTFFVINYGMNQSLKLHRYITHNVLRRYLPQSMVESASAGELRLDDPPERRVVTVLFSDLVGFTAMSERLGPDAVAEHLNSYLSAMANLANEHGATVDKFVGDAVMIVFGAPDSMAPREQARRTAELALDMVALASDMEGESLQLRVGINTGDAVVGNFGSQYRSDYTVIGPTVNLAARLEHAAEPGRVLVGPETARLLDHLELEPVGRLSLKGLSDPVEAWMLPVQPKVA